jgi:UDP-N-acetylglucosamine--N-acetylmuramyl-(pentapeptide) pyrophosphoryl-undecaprenol N-acetylglucosamine transferase
MAASLKIVFTGGGTGGHIYPALALIEALQSQHPDANILYIGNRNAMESRLVPDHGIAFQGVLCSGMPRRPGWSLVQWLWQLQVAIDEAKQLLKDFAPQVVMGTGGYASAPVLLAAKQLGIPFVIHEPDAHPGLVNKLCSRWAAVATTAFKTPPGALKAKQVLNTGNPLRQSVLALLTNPPPRQANLASLGLDHWQTNPERPIISVMGGSQGARSINLAIAGAATTLIDHHHVRLIHQTGEKRFDETRTALPQSLQDHPDYCLRPYFTNMAPVLALANLAVARAGSLSLSELYLSGVPSLLVPYPFAAANHQWKNAQASAQAGASLILADDDCTPQKLLSLLVPLLQDAPRLRAMAHASQQLAHPHAADQILEQLLAIATRR